MKQKERNKKCLKIIKEFDNHLFRIELFMHGKDIGLRQKTVFFPWSKHLQDHQFTKKEFKAIKAFKRIYDSNFREEEGEYDCFSRRF